MGFKCPVCMKDFKIDIKKWKKHLKEEHNGIGIDIFEKILIKEDIAKSIKQKKEKKGSEK